MVLDVHLERYDGPLDLLIHLIHRHELDIFEVSISEITDKFVEEIRRMHALDMDVAAEFIELASYLICLKSRLMLPVSFPELPEDDPEAVFAGKLLELAFSKEISLNLKEREKLSGRFLVRRQALTLSNAEMFREDPFVLANLFFEAGENKKEKKLVMENMTKQAEAVMRQTTEILTGRKETLWSLLARIFPEKLRRAVSFITVLELSKQNEVNSYQDGNFSEILIRNEKWKGE